MTYTIKLIIKIIQVSHQIDKLSLELSATSQARFLIKYRNNFTALFIKPIVEEKQAAYITEITIPIGLRRQAPMMSITTRSKQEGNPFDPKPADDDELNGEKPEKRQA